METGGLRLYEIRLIHVRGETSLHRRRGEARPGVLWSVPLDSQLARWAPPYPLFSAFFVAFLPVEVKTGCDGTPPIVSRLIVFRLHKSFQVRVFRLSDGNFMAFWSTACHLEVASVARWRCHLSRNTTKRALNKEYGGAHLASCKCSGDQPCLS